jgi:Ca2+-binding RTX toxin-like protein
MRRTIALLTTMAMTLLVATSVALAATVNCPFYGHCSGTDAGDTIHGDDRTYGRRGGDFIFGMNGNDQLHGSEGYDTLAGGDGDDIHNGGPGGDTFDGGPGYDQYRDDSMDSSDTYFGLMVNGVTGAPMDTSVDLVRDYGGNDDSLDLSSLNRSQVLINWSDSPDDADANLDRLFLWQKDTTNLMHIFNYFDNKGGTGRGAGAIELVKFKDVTYTQFPIPHG